MPTVQSIANSIRSLFADTSVPIPKTRERLEELQNLIDDLLDALDSEPDHAPDDNDDDDDTDDDNWSDDTDTPD